MPFFGCKEVFRIREIICGAGAITLDVAKGLEDATINSRTLPKTAFFTKPLNYIAGSGRGTKADEIDPVDHLFFVDMEMIDASMGNSIICAVAADTLRTIVK